MSRSAAITVAVLVLAATAAAIEITKCDDADCKVGCTSGNYQEGWCIAPQSDRMLACTATTRYTFTVAKYNGTGCMTEASRSLGVCNQCRKGDDGKYAMMIGCEGFSTSSPMLDQYDCDSTCTTCKSVKVLKDQCLGGKHDKNSWAFVGTQAPVDGFYVNVSAFPSGNNCTRNGESRAVPVGACLPPDGFPRWNGVKVGSLMFSC
jgi:hypothetical protein